MRIVMLGHSSAGKTTYMAAMYRFMNDGRKGFKIVAADAAQHARLIDDADGIKKGIYPDPTSQRAEYQFTLYFKGKRVSTFVWADYRGGALSERSSSEDAAALRNDIKESDAVVVFADAYELATEPDSRRAVRRLTVLMQQAIADGRTAVPLVLAYTKADKVKSADEWSLAVEPFEQVSHALETSGSVKGAIVTISCGRRPKAVHIPVLWCLSNGLANEIQALQNKADSYQQWAKEAGKNGSIGNSWKSWRDGTESEWQKKKRYLKEAQDRLNEMRPLLRPAQQLASTVERDLRKERPPRAYRNAVGG